jgi:hypothetical protein
MRSSSSGGGGGGDDAADGEGRQGRARPRAQLQHRGPHTRLTDELEDRLKGACVPPELDESEGECRVRTRRSSTSSTSSRRRRRTRRRRRRRRR